MTKPIITRLLVALCATFWGILGGCPTGTGTGGGTSTTSGQGQDAGTVEVETGLTVTLTGIPVRFDASLEVGDDLIVFGTGNLTGVGYVVPSTSPTAATAIGNFRNAGFAVAGKKVLLFNDMCELTVFDTAGGASASIPREQVCLAPIPERDDRDVYSPVVADGQLAVVLNRADEVADGNLLKLLDLTASEPAITPLNNPPVNVAQLAISSTDQRLVAYGQNSFFIYDLRDPSAQPTQIDVSAQGGIMGPFAYDNGYIIYVARDATQNMRLLNVATGASTALALNPGNRDLTLSIRGGRYAYFLSRNAYDTYSVVYRAAVGTPGTEPIEGGVPADDPRDNTYPWVGYGNDIAITPDGQRVFISGNEAISSAAEFLQVSTGGGSFKVFASGSGFLSASDVDAGAGLVAFKTGSEQDTRLGYIVLP